MTAAVQPQQNSPFRGLLGALDSVSRPGALAPSCCSVLLQAVGRVLGSHLGNRQQCCLLCTVGSLPELEE